MNDYKSIPGQLSKKTNNRYAECTAQQKAPVTCKVSNAPAKESKFKDNLIFWYLVGSSMFKNIYI